MVPSWLPLSYLSALVLVLTAGAPPSLGRGFTDQPNEDRSFINHGNILSPLLKALSEHEPFGIPLSRTRPDSRYVRFMKKLYKLSSKHERNHEASHLYNTVRLITPREECLDPCGEFLMQDISYSLHRVRAQEQLLKSVLLYSFDHNHAVSPESICYLHIREQASSDGHMCLGSPIPPRFVTPISFHFRANRASRHKWVEVDVTSFFQPLNLGHKKDIHLLINLTCLMDEPPEPGRRVSKSSVELTHMAPSLLLYLNDTSEVAHQRGLTQTTRSNHWDEEVQSHYRGSGLLRQMWRDRRSTSNASHPPKTTGKSESLDWPKFENPTDDCDLYDFRVSFTQLKLDHWIIAPSKYNPRYCKGICPRVVGHIYGSPVHTMVQNIIYEKLDSTVPRPSCVPSEYDPLSVLTIENDGSIAYKEYEEMIARRCTCR